MSSQTNGNVGWRRAVIGALASGALAAGLVIGIGAPVAIATPAADPTADADAPAPMTADQVLAIIQTDYDLGSGGGQLSNLIHTVMKLRAQGYMPSNGNKAAIVEALDHRPDQTPLIEALQATVAHQRVEQARAQAAIPSPNPTTIGINQQDPNNPGAGGSFGVSNGDTGFTINPGGQ